jgi:GT2 family glycosyltransferase
MNPVLVLTHNCLELTKRCVESVWRQDTETFIYFEDNNSKDGTGQWIYRNCDGKKMDAAFWSENRGVSFGWNDGLKWLFDKGAEHVLVLNNDVIIPPWFYRCLLSCDLPFVTGVARDVIPTVEPMSWNLESHPDFSAFLIRRDCWEQVGPFDESMVMYAQDTDYHVRAHRLGIPLQKACVEYYHLNSQTLKNAPPDEQKVIREQAHRDRGVFRSKYGCVPGTKEYEQLFQS